LDQEEKKEEDSLAARLALRKKEQNAIKEVDDSSAT